MVIMVIESSDLGAAGEVAVASELSGETCAESVLRHNRLQEALTVLQACKSRSDHPVKPGGSEDVCAPAVLLPRLR